MQEPALRCVLLKGGCSAPLHRLLPERHRQRQKRKPLARTKDTRTQHPPARAKVQKGLLRTGEPGLRPRSTVPALRRPACLGRAKPRGDRAGVDPRRDRGLFCGQSKKPRGGMGRPALAATSGHKRLHLEIIPLIAAAQPHPQRPALVFGKIQRREKGQIADPEPRADPRRRPVAALLQSPGLSRKLQIAGSRQQGLAFPGAVAIKNPLPALHDAGKQPVAGGIKARPAQHRLTHRHLRRLLATQPVRQALGSHADALPDPPIQRHHPGCTPGPRLGKGIQIFIRRHIIDLPRRPRHRRGRGKQHQKLQHPIREQPVDHPGAVQLGGKNLFYPGRILAEDRPIRHHPRRMDHHIHRPRVQGRRLHRRPHLEEIGHIGRSQRDAAAAFLRQRLQPFHREDPARDRIAGRMARKPGPPRRALGQARAGDQRHLRAVPPDQLFRQGQADAAKAAGDQHMRAIGKIKARLRQRRRAQAFAIAPRTAQGGDTTARRQRLFDHSRDQRLRQRLTAPQLRQLQIQLRQRQPRQLFCRYQHRPAQERLFRPAGPAAFHRRRAIGQEGQLDTPDKGLSGEVLPRQRLHKEKRRPEPLLNQPLREAGARAETLIPGHQPAMQDMRRRDAAPSQIADQRLIPLQPALGRECIAVLALAAETVAGGHKDHPMPGLAQPRGSRRTKPGIIGKDQPACRGEIVQIVNVKPGKRRRPMALPAPVREIFDPRRQLCLGRRRLTRCDKKRFALKGIAGQRHALTRPPTPDLAPIDRNPAGPEPRDRADQPGIIGDPLFRMTQSRHHLARRHTVRPRQRRQRAARPHLHIDAARNRHQRRQPGTEIHRIPQMRDPVIGAGRLGIRQHRAAAVRDDRDLRHRQPDAAQIGAEILQDRIEHTAMGGDVDRDPLRLDLIHHQPRRQSVKRRIRARDHAKPRRIDRGHIEIIGPVAPQIRLGQRHGKHPPRRHAVEKPAAEQDKTDAILETHHARQSGGGVLAHRMADQRGGGDAPAFIKLRQREFGDHNQRQLHRGLFQRLIRRLFGALLGQPERADVVIQLRLQHREAPVHPVAEDRLGLVKIAGHAGKLRAATGEHEDHFGVVAQMVMVEDKARIGAFQQARRLIMAFRHDDPALLEGAAALFQGPGDIGQLLVRMGAQMGGQSQSLALQRSFRAGRDHQRLEWPVAVLGCQPQRRLLQHRMGIRAADAKAVDACPQDRCLPGHQPVIDAKGRGLKINRRVRRLIAEARRQFAVMQRQRHLDQTGNPRRCIEMADIRLDRADAAMAHRIRRLAESIGQRRNLDRVAEICSGAVAFDIGHRICGDPGQRLGLGNTGRLAIDRGREIARLGGAVIVDRGRLQDRPDMIAVPDRIDRAAQHHTARARAEHRPLRPVVKGMAMPVRRQDLTVLEQIAPRMGQLDGHPTRQRHVAFAVQQRLRGVMYGDKAGRAGGLHIDRRALEIKDMAGAGGQKILVIAGMAQKEHAGLFDQIGVRTKVEIEIRSHAAAGPDPDRAGEGLGRVAGIFQRLPGDLQELAVLRIKDCRLFRGKAEELGIECLEPVQHGGRGHIIRPRHPGSAFPRRQQFLA